MGDCIYCGQSAGIFRKYHKECNEKCLQGCTQLSLLVEQAMKEGKDSQEVKIRVRNITSINSIPAERVRDSLVLGWERTLDQFMADKVLSTEEEDRLMALANTFNLGKQELDGKGAFTRTLMNGALRDILEGKLPSRVKFDGPIPFNFQKGESLAWIFNNVPYFEEKIRRHYEGGYSGVSVRVMKGVYYRTGGFKGYPVETSQMVQVDSGAVGITTKHIYFAGKLKSFRVPYSKIVSFNPYTDALSICRDAANAKAQVFKTGEGWFIYNLVVNLSQRSEA
jgi:hypothetical protein